MRACWLKWVGRDWSISADYIWLNYSGANNAVGGADLILENMIDGIVIPDLSNQALLDGITSACNLTDHELTSMKRAALEKALKLFESDNYIDSFSSFLNSVLSIRD